MALKIMRLTALEFHGRTARPDGYLSGDTHATNGTDMTGRIATFGIFDSHLTQGIPEGALLAAEAGAL